MSYINAFSNFINSNSYINSFAIICSIISLFISIKVERTLHKAAERKFYNNTHEYYIDRFIGFRDYLVSGSPINSKTLSEIYSELISLESQCSSVFSLKDRITIFRLKKQTTTDTFNANRDKIIQFLSYWIGRLQKKEDEQ